MTRPGRDADALRAFETAHGGASAVIAPIGRRGARIVLVGADGAWGDSVSASADEARTVCEAAGIPVADGWSRQLAAAVRTGPAEWRRMGGV